MLMRDEPGGAPALLLDFLQSMPPSGLKICMSYGWNVFLQGLNFSRFCDAAAAAAELLFKAAAALLRHAKPSSAPLASRLFTCKDFQHVIRDNEAGRLHKPRNVYHPPPSPTSQIQILSPPTALLALPRSFPPS